MITNASYTGWYYYWWSCGPKGAQSLSHLYDMCKISSLYWWSQGSWRSQAHSLPLYFDIGWNHNQVVQVPFLNLEKFSHWNSTCLCFLVTCYIYRSWGRKRFYLVTLYSHQSSTALKKKRWLYSNLNENKFKVNMGYTSLSLGQFWSPTFPKTKNS